MGVLYYPHLSQERPFGDGPLSLRDCLQGSVNTCGATPGPPLIQVRIFVATQPRSEGGRSEQRLSVCEPPLPYLEKTTFL